jgi:hypothetical protein
VSVSGSTRQKGGVKYSTEVSRPPRVSGAHFVQQTDSPHVQVPAVTRSPAIVEGWEGRAGSSGRSARTVMSSSRTMPGWRPSCEGGQRSSSCPTSLEATHRRSWPGSRETTNAAMSDRRSSTPGAAVALDSPERTLRRSSGGTSSSSVSRLFPWVSPDGIWDVPLRCADIPPAAVTPQWTSGHLGLRLGRCRLSTGWSTLIRRRRCPLRPVAVVVDRRAEPAICWRSSGSSSPRTRSGRILTREGIDAPSTEARRERLRRRSPDPTPWRAADGVGDRPTSCRSASDCAAP